MSAFTDRVTDDDIRWLRAQILSDPTDYPRDFTGWIGPWVGLAGIDVPISQIVGFAQFTAQVAPTIATSQSTTSATYTNLGTVGPQLTGLPDGNYLLLYRASVVNNTAGVGCLYSPKINGTEATDADAANASGVELTTAVGFTVKELKTGGNNTILMRYRTDGVATATYGGRWLVAFRYANV